MQKEGTCFNVASYQCHTRKKYGVTCLDQRKIAKYNHLKKTRKYPLDLDGVCMFIRKFDKIWYFQNSITCKNNITELEPL